MVRHGLSESEAFLVEAALIDCLDGLTNAVSGHGATIDRRPITEYAMRFGAAPVADDNRPAVLIRLARWKDAQEELEPGLWRKGSGYRIDMPDSELVDSTRAWWKISPHTVSRKGIEHAVAVHEGVTRAVMEIGEWTQRTDGRRAFKARLISAGPVFDAWVGSLGRRTTFASNSQNPIADPDVGLSDHQGNRLEVTRKRSRSEGRPPFSPNRSTGRSLHSR